MKEIFLAREGPDNDRFVSSNEAVRIIQVSVGNDAVSLQPFLF